MSVLWADFFYWVKLIMFDYTITNIEYITGLNKARYTIRRTNESNVIAQFSFIEYTSDIIELTSFYSNEENYKDLELILIELLETYYNDRNYLLIHEDLKESTKFPFESILNDYTIYNTTYLRYQI
ncbi:MAG: hypothetical protein R3321_10950 [Nitrososphaeraceae archaeon]|nr:hypothetical protein [Nitrososphaeraceae archaeon]